MVSQTLKQEIRQAQLDLDLAFNMFNNAEGDMIDSASYGVNAAQSRLNSLLSRARQEDRKEVKVDGPWVKV
jgi:exonuclease VII small subunit